ncbi:hypothetical protein EMGBS8_13280 [Verrucomicrobiota bacterium]|nr:hypothetical protein EMGBS8_13280 [Verrucomicrobiota bacterium]
MGCKSSARGFVQWCYETYPILLLTLVAAAASAAPVGGSGLNYNRVAVGYVTSDALKGFDVSATAELANSGVLISGSYSDVDGKGSLAGFGGYMTGFGVAYKFNVGAGDLAVGLGYQQGQFGASNGFAVAEQTALGIQYRQALGSSVEFSVGYQRVRTNIGALVVVGGVIDGAVDSANETSSTSVSAITSPRTSTSRCPTSSLVRLRVATPSASRLVTASKLHG